MNLPLTYIEISVILPLLVVGTLLIAIRKGETGHANTFAFGVLLIITTLFHAAIHYGWIGNGLAVISLLYFISLGLPACVLAFSLEQLAGRKWLPLVMIALVVMLPVLIQGFILIGQQTGFLYTLDPSNGFETLQTREVYAWLSMIYSRGILVAALIVLGSSIAMHLPARQNKGLAIIIIAGLLTVLIDIFRFSDLIPLTEPILNLLSFGIVGVGFIINKFTFDPNQAGQVHDTQVLDHLEDGVFVLNGSDTITRMNSAAEQIVGIRARETNGRHIDQIFQNWHTINQQDGSEEEMGFRSNVSVDGDWKTLDIRIIMMDSQDPSNGSKILIVRDITDSQSDTAQYARESMLLFLRSLANAFKDAPTIQEFLNQALFQTLYTFNLEDGFLYLFESTSQTGEMSVSLAARHGALDGDRILSHLYPSKKILQSEVKREPFIIKDGRKDERLAACFENTEGKVSLAFFPLAGEEEIFGMLVLGRMGYNGFNPYEVMRLGSAADEIASYILKEREKQRQIALMERQRLVIDLHDSITQKLYGLLTMTEAVQIGFQAGAIDKTRAMMSMVSENARQAVREMRLFLHQLDPVDIGRIGFVAAIQHRLMAVEGRAEIKTNFKPDGKFSFSLEKERALYFITEEALNNVLKHARAKSVEVKLQREDGLVHLDIIDDGICFDPGQSDTGGRGLRNMQERAAQIGGKLTISSEKGKGTKISLSFPE